MSCYNQIYELKFANVWLSVSSIVIPTNGGTDWTWTFFHHAGNNDDLH